MINTHKMIAVIGLGRFGSSVATTLMDLGYEVLGVDSDEALVQEFSDELTHVIKADSTNEEALREAGVQNCDGAVVAIGTDIESSVMTTLLLKEMGIPYIIAKATSSLHGKVLDKIGIDRVIYPEKDMGARVAFHFMSASIVDLLQITPQICLVEFKAPTSFVGKSIKEIQFRDIHRISVSAIRRNDKMIVPPKSAEVVQEGDVIFAIGEKQTIKTLTFLQ